MEYIMGPLDGLISALNMANNIITPPVAPIQSSVEETEKREKEERKKAKKNSDEYKAFSAEKVPKVDYKTVNRHLLLVESTEPTAVNYISKEQIAMAKNANIDVLYVIRENMWNVLSAIDDYKVKWTSINVLFHGNSNIIDNSISVFGVKMSMNHYIMKMDRNVINMALYFERLSSYTKHSIYIYTCAVGFADGLKELCNILHKKCQLSEGIFLSTDITGNDVNLDGTKQNWNVEWGAKYGFLTKGIHDNNIEHATKDLFQDISLLTFTLSNGPESGIEEVEPEPEEEEPEPEPEIVKVDINPEIVAIVELSGEKEIIDAIDELVVKLTSFNDANVIYTIKNENINRVFGFINNIKNSFSLENNMIVMQKIGAIIKMIKPSYII